MDEKSFIKNKILIKIISDWCFINNEDKNIYFSERDIVDDVTISFTTSYLRKIDNYIKYYIAISGDIIIGKLVIDYFNIKNKNEIDKIIKKLEIECEKKTIIKQWVIDSSEDHQFLNINLDNFYKNILLFEKELSEVDRDSIHDYYIEGALKEITSNKYERNKEARKACLDHYGTKCQICGNDLGKIYGDEFSGKIEVHHILPLSEIKKTYRVDPIKDLIPVCPNCHLILHSKKEGVFTPEELRKLLNK